MKMRSLVILAAALTLSACATSDTTPPTDKSAVPLSFTKADWTQLPDWQRDNVAAALPALKTSCARIMKRTASQDMGRHARFGTVAQWTPGCQALQAAADDTGVRRALQSHFIPWQAIGNTDGEGLFTGYYEASLNGSLTRTGPYQTPLHARPTDLVQVDLGDFRPELKGQRIAGRVTDGRLKPFEDRATIIKQNREVPLIWVDDPIGAFFLQIQGSGVVRLTDGTTRRIGFDGQNGHVYTAIGKELAAAGHMRLEDVSMPAIRDWLRAHPDKAAEMMNRNKSYVFFKEMDQPGAVGGEGVVLTPGRSLAVDYTKWAYGVPVWLDAAPAKAGQPAVRRLMVAQDTGGAIRGPVRGDVFWGFGPAAEDNAGHMKSPGRLWALLPQGVTP
ncbi:MAG: murein transglycosylase A [Pseudomonadota bacterium]